MGRRWGGRRTQALRRLVLAAYGARCHLCGDAIDLALRKPDPLSLSIDHVVPRSRGGSDDLSNLRPAHLGCNSARQATPMSHVTPPRDERRFFGA